MSENNVPESQLPEARIPQKGAFDARVKLPERLSFSACEKRSGVSLMLQLLPLAFQAVLLRSLG